MFMPTCNYIHFSYSGGILYMKKSLKIALLASSAIAIASGASANAGLAKANKQFKQLGTPKW